MYLSSSKRLTYTNYGIAILIIEVIFHLHNSYAPRGSVFENGGFGKRKQTEFRLLKGSFVYTNYHIAIFIIKIIFSLHSCYAPKASTLKMGNKTTHF